MVDAAVPCTGVVVVDGRWGCTMYGRVVVDSRCGCTFHLGAGACTGRSVLGRLPRPPKGERVHSNMRGRGVGTGWHRDYAYTYRT